MIRNPYAKKGSPQKRQRPWEQEPNAQNTQQHQQQVFARPSCSYGTRKPTPLRNGDISQNDSPGPELNDSFDDGGIDWDAAVRVLDETTTTTASQQTTSTTTKPPHQPINGVTVGPREHNTSRPVETLNKPPVVATSAPSHASGGSLSAISKNRNPRPTSNDSVKGPTASVDTTLRQSAVAIRAHTTSMDTSRQSAVASLRPANWNQPKAAANPSPVQKARFDDPRQASLPVPLQFDPERVKPVQDEHRQQLVKHAELSAPLLNGWTLFSHQKKSILQGLLMRRLILALDMGLGKTLIGCVWAKAFYKTFGVKAIVICPVSLKKEWKRTAEEATGLQVQDEKKDSLDEDSTDLFICSWAKIPTKLKSRQYVVVADEAHSIQSMQAARTKDTLKLVSSDRCLGVLLLTGTPMKNGKPSNLFPLLKAVRHPFGNNQRAYESHFCAGREQNFGKGVVWNASGSSNLGQLRELVASHMLHLTKEDCLKELPPQTRVFHHVPVSSRKQLQHNQALQDLARVYNSSKSSMGDNGEAVLGAVQKVRMVGSFAKIDATVNLAKSILQEEPAVVVFSSFQKVAQQVYQQLAEAGWKGELLTGETPAKKRQGMVDNFQNGLSPVFVCTFGAGGVGLTLTAAHSVILLDRPWTPGDAHQAEDRVRRIGQTKPVRSIWMSAFDLDKQIDALLESKKQTAATVLTKGAEPSESAAPKLSIFQLLKTIMPANPSGMVQTTLDQFSQSQNDHAG